MEVRFVERLCPADDNPVIAEEKSAECGDSRDPDQIAEVKIAAREARRSEAADGAECTVINALAALCESRNVSSAS